ncbi:MAG: hypothetical protein ACREI9_09355 [Nitrospiraceae bacterium]
MKIKTIRGVRVGDGSVAVGTVLSTPGDLSEAQARGMIEAQKAVIVSDGPETSAVASGAAPAKAAEKSAKKDGKKGKKK